MASVSCHPVSCSPVLLKMPDRADYLARTLITRLANLQARVVDDGRAEPDRRQRIETIEKVLAVELGLTDSATLALIEATVPRIKAGVRAPDRELAGFADFLRQRLATHLAEQ
jgi:hypothetical protein